MKKPVFKKVWVIDGNYGELIETKAALIPFKRDMWDESKEYLVYNPETNAFSIAEHRTVFEKEQDAISRLESERKKHKVFLEEQGEYYQKRLKELKF